MLAGGVVFLAGAGAAFEAATYRIGSLAAMGPGFFPLMLGITLVVLGGIIAFGSADPVDDGAGALDWRGCLCIVAGMLAFIALGETAGLGPAAFATVFIAALGDRQATLRSAAMLAAGISIFAVILFGYLLQVQLPIVGGY